MVEHGAFLVDNFAVLAQRSEAETAPRLHPVSF